MKRSLLLVAALLAGTASAQPGVPPTPIPPPAPAPAPVPADPAEPAAEPAEPPSADAPTPAPVPPEEPPKVDPAYGERPDESVVDPAASDMPGIRRGRDIVLRYRPDRSRSNMLTTAAIAGAGVVFGAIGLYFHFESRSDSEQVSANRFTGRAWTQDRQGFYDDAHRNATIATVMYGVGGALLLTTVIYYIVTEPPQQEMVITPRGKSKPVTLVVPTEGGAMVGGAWSF